MVDRFSPTNGILPYPDRGDSLHKNIYILDQQVSSYNFKGMSVKRLLSRYGEQSNPSIHDNGWAFRKLNPGDISGGAGVNADGITLIDKIRHLYI